MDILKKLMDRNIQMYRTT